MEQPHRSRGRSRRVSLCVATAALAVGGLSASIGVVRTAGAASSHQTKIVVISTVKNARIGTILVSGKTLYTLRASKAACTAQCLKYWPEVLLPKGVTRPTAGSGVSAAKLGTVKRAGGALQVTYSGKALYWFSGDTAGGQIHGNGVTDTWGTWSVVTARLVRTSPPLASGAPAPTTSPSPTTTTTTAKPPTTTTTASSSGGVGF